MADTDHGAAPPAPDIRAGRLSAEDYIENFSDLHPPFTVHEAHVEADEPGPHGIVYALGDAMGGYALYGLDGVPVFVVSIAGDLVRVAAPAPLGPGRRVLRVRYRLTDGEQGELELLADHESLAVAAVPQAMPVAWQHGGTGLRLGADVGLAVSDDYTPPFPWAGTIDRVVVSGHGNGGV